MMRQYMSIPSGTPCWLICVPNHVSTYAGGLYRSIISSILLGGCLDHIVSTSPICVILGGRSHASLAPFDKVFSTRQLQTKPLYCESFIGAWLMPYLILVEALRRRGSQPYRAIEPDNLRRQSIPVAYVCPFHVISIASKRFVCLACAEIATEPLFDHMIINRGLILG